MDKKREILPFIHAAIAKLTDMAADGAKLEYQDNEQASLRLKKSIVEFKKNELISLENASKGIRLEIKRHKQK